MSEKRTDNDATVHDQILWVLHKSGMEDLLLYISSSADEAQYCLHVVEIISLMFREQVRRVLSVEQTTNSRYIQNLFLEQGMGLLYPDANFFAGSKIFSFGELPKVNGGAQGR